MTVPESLSYGQRRLLFLNELSRDASYNCPLAIRLRGELDRPALGAALADLLDRHEILRTVYPRVDGVAVPRVLPPREAAIGPHLVTVPDGAEHELIAELATGPFDLGRDLPIRAWLLALGPREHVLLLVLHHIATDGWSTRPLLADLDLAYRARCSGSAPDQEPLPVQYADFAQWQHQMLGEADEPTSLMAEQLDYWTTTLAGLPEEIALPRNRPRPATAGAADVVPLEFDRELHEGLVALARRTDVTLFMLLHTTFALLLHRLGAGTDIPLGTPVAGRTDEALDDLIGFFVNTLVLRTDLTGNPTFTQLLHRTRHTDLHAFAHQDLPFERLVETLNPPRSTTRHPLFQTMIVLQNHGRGEQRLHDLAVEVEQVPTHLAKCDLMLAAGELRDGDGRAAGISGALEYAVDLFDRASVEAMAERLTRLLRQVVERPDAPIGDLDVLDPDERQRMLAGWNDTSVAVAPDTLASLGARQAARTPAAVALVADDPAGRVQLSYAEFDALVGRLAGALRRRGAGPGRTVAVSMPRSADLVVALH
ncbi:MAG: AMP-binding protein, partial [Actinobacteria bacterium]|nr:AMP-binding protein [Actinomycetota bacterium]